MHSSLSLALSFHAAQLLLMALLLGSVYFNQGIPYSSALDPLPIFLLDLLLFVLWDKPLAALRFSDITKDWSRTSHMSGKLCPTKRHPILCVWQLPCVSKLYPFDIF